MGPLARRSSLLLLLAYPVLPLQAQSSAPLRRRADWRASISFVADSGAVVRRIAEGSPAARAGLRVGDRILAIGNAPVDDRDSYRRRYRALMAGDTVELRVLRRGDTVRTRFVLDPVPLEKIHGVTIAYGSVASPRGYRVRVVVTRPVGTGGARLPAILFIPWLSCDPVERPIPGSDGFAHLLHTLASRSRMVLVRVEKPGVGDSEGPDCGDTELEDDLTAFRAALRDLRARADVDSSRIFLLGGSIGGALAPLLAAENPRGIAGVISVGGFTRTWYEHMLEIERNILQLSGRSPGDVNAAMRGISRFYTEYLLSAHTPSQVLGSHPELRLLWQDEPERQYGRLASYYHAVQLLDVERAWSAVAERAIPALVLWGEYDWIMGRAEAERAVQIVNARRAGSGTLVVLPRTDHGLMTYASLQAAFDGQSPQWDGAPAEAILSWLRTR
jgi:pimeloyl-ACP methyl ester carboxylesterase